MHTGGSGVCSSKVNVHYILCNARRGHIVTYFKRTGCCFRLTGRRRQAWEGERICVPAGLALAVFSLLTSGVMVRIASACPQCYPAARRGCGVEERRWFGTLAGGICYNAAAAPSVPPARCWRVPTFAACAAGRAVPSPGIALLCSPNAQCLLATFRLLANGTAVNGARAENSMVHPSARKTSSAL